MTVFFMPKLDLEKLRRIPILDVADALGMDLVKEGSTWAMRDQETGKGASSLTLFPGSNRWKRWSGIERGGVSSGSVIDLYMHVRNTTDVTEAIQWLSNRFL